MEAVLQFLAGPEPATWLLLQDAPGATDAGRSVSRAEIVESLTDPAARLSMDPIAAEQVLQDMQRDSSSALPDTWVTNMNANVLVPQMQTMLR